MSNSEEEKRIQKFIENLKDLRKETEELLARVPLKRMMSLKSMDEIPSKEDRERFLGFSISACFKFEIGTDVPGQLSSSMISVEDEELFEWHRNEFPPILEKVEKLLRDKIAPLTNQAPAETKGAMPVSDTRKDAFARIMQFAREKLYDHDESVFVPPSDVDSVDVRICEEIVKRPYFEPDAWRENELFPFVVAQRLGEIPDSIRDRVDEIRQSFTFGNWMAVIALSRCLLEYALVKRKNILKLEVYKDRKQTRIRPLSELIEDSANNCSKLSKKIMDRIKDAGDAVMHPDREKSARYPPNKDTAKKRVNDIVEIIAALYGK